MYQAPRPEVALEALADLLGPFIAQKQAAQYGVGLKHDTPGAPTNLYMHGPGGLLTFPGADPVVFHTIMGAQSLLSNLPANPSLYMNPTYYTITGVQGDTGSEKNTVCANAPVAGAKKACLTTSVFGRYERSTAEIELNRLGQLIDRSDPMDLVLVGNPLAQQNPVFGAGPGSVATPNDLLVNEVSQKFWDRAISFHRLLSLQAWTGNPINNSVGGGYREMTSIPVLVNTGYVDAETGQTCPSVDSYVRNYGYGRVDANCDNLVAAITDMYYQVKDRAFRSGMSPVRWVIAMRPQLFYAITGCWPCSYLTTGCVLPNANHELTIDSADQIRLRDEMRSGKYLLIDGERVQVILDDSIPEDTNTTNANVPSGCFGTDIFLLPMSVVGGRSVFFLEYFQYANPSLIDAIGNMVLGKIEGAFLTWVRQTNQCVQWQSKIEPRLVLRTPWLAARLDDVVYCPIQHERDADPAGPYHVDGGRTYRPGPSYYNVWQASR